MLMSMGDKGIEALKTNNVWKEEKIHKEVELRIIMPILKISYITLCP